MIAKPFLLDEFSAAVRKALADGQETRVA